MRNRFTKDYYSILKLSPDASQDEIRKSYITLSKRYHPDTGGSTEKMSELNEAYSVLRYTHSRTEYNQWYYSYHETECSSKDSTKSSTKKNTKITLHILDYEKGYIKTQREAVFFGDKLNEYLTNGQIYSYMKSSDQKTIVLIHYEIFNDMYEMYTAKEVQCTVLEKHNVYFKRIPVDFIKNNYRKYITPNDLCVFLKYSKTHNGYIALNREEWLKLKNEQEEQKKQREETIKGTLKPIVAIFAFFAILLFLNSNNSNQSIDTFNNKEPAKQTNTESLLDTVTPPPHNTTQRYRNSDCENLVVKTQLSDNTKYYYIKITRPNSSQAEQTIFIHAGQTAYAYVPPGTYDIKWVSGDTWYGSKYLFGNDSAQKANETTTFDTESQWTITLYPVSNGNLYTEQIDISEF